MTELFKNNPETETERILANLCQNSFLSLWTFPCVYNDKKLSKNKIGKELCDNLVVFDKHIILFSDKECAFPDTGNIQIDWNRWYKNAILSSAKQLIGAETWLRNYPNRVFLDKKCSTPFPYDLSTIENFKIHKIITAWGAEERCKKYFYSNKLGSLKIKTDVIEKEHIDRYENILTCGFIKQKHGYIHIFNDSTLKTVLSELDTISDFTEYLEEKEKFIFSERFHVADGEEDILAYYMANYDDNGKRFFKIPDDHSLIYLPHEGNRLKYFQSKQYIGKKEEDKVSYLWDQTIENFSYYLMNKELISYDNNTFIDHEKALRLLASENRFSRRFLSKALYEVIMMPKAPKRRRLILSDYSEDAIYVFGVYDPDNQFKSFEKFLDHKRADLFCACHAAKVNFPDRNIIIGIGITHPDNLNGNEDLILLETTDWTEKDFEEARKIQTETNIFVNPSIKQATEFEYPELS